MSRITLLDVHESSIRRFDPRVRLAWIFGVSIAVIAFRSLFSFGWLLIGLLCIWASAGVLRIMLAFSARMLPLALFLALLSLATAFVERYGLRAVLTEPAVWVPGPLDLIDAAVKSLRFLIMVTAARFLFLTTDFAEITGGIRSLQRAWLGQRLNTFIELFAFVIGLSFQSVPLIVNEMAAVVEAERGRGVDVNAGNRIIQIRSYVRMAPTLIMRCISISQFTIMALINFRFNPFKPRTMYRHFAFGRNDWVAFALIIAIPLAISLLERLY
jgi:energy-coupling factor transport system permease protein